MSTIPAHRTSGVTESKLMSGSQILLECLVRENVDCIFGYPGGVTLPLYDALYDHPISTSWCGTSRTPRSRRKATRAPRARWACAARLPAPARPIWSPAWSMR